MEKIKNVLVCDGIKAELFEDNGKFKLVYRLNGNEKTFESTNMKDIDTIINTLKKMKPVVNKKEDSMTTTTDNIILTSEFGEGRLDKVKDNFGDLLNMFSIQQRTNDLIKVFPNVDKYELKKIAEMVVKEGITDYKKFAARKLMIEAENKVLNDAKKKRPNKNDFINKGLTSSFTPDEIRVDSDDLNWASLTSKPKDDKLDTKNPEDDMPIILEATTDNPDYEELCDILEEKTDNAVVVAYQEEDMMNIAVIVANDGKEIKLIKAVITENKMSTYDVVYRVKTSEYIEDLNDIDAIEAQEDRMIITADNYMDALLAEKVSKENENEDGTTNVNASGQQLVINAPKMGDDLLSLGQSKLTEIFEEIAESVENPDKVTQKDVIFEGRGFIAECEYNIDSEKFYVVTLNNQIPLYITKDKKGSESAYTELLNVFNS